MSDASLYTDKDNIETISSLTSGLVVESESDTNAHRRSVLFNLFTSVGRYTLLFIMSASFLVLSAGLMLGESASRLKLQVTLSGSGYPRIANIIVTEL
ncbi:MAG: hypothetical protein ACOZAO_01845 [Patescibacteria group bacterium]